ncbi:phage tail protein [Falsihalocynthiibacter sp. S25ZX9]|uniref:phage tail protein n=1 Tax=Falsihalocynthiibacter sp. S25ZX9 TaxID=3240870 RepID=UPI00350F259E
MLAFDVDDSRLTAIADEFAASPKQIDMAFGRALNRTAGTLRKLSVAGLKTELGLRTTTALRNRIKQYKYSGRRGRGVRVWIGSNDLPLSAFKGRPQKTATGVKFGDVEIHGAFLATRGGKRGVYQRVSNASFPIASVSLPVSDRIMTFIEDNVFVDLESIFFKNFAADIKARTIYGVGK